MQFGAFFPTRDMPADRTAIRDWAQAVEGIGFDYIQVPDHVLGADRAALPDFEGPYDIDDTFHEVFVTLGYLAAITERVGLSTGVLILPQRQTALVAKQAAQIDILCDGRFRLGVGVGWNPVEYVALGQDWNTRGRRQAEQIELMNRYWTERTVDFTGEFDRVHHAGVSPPSIQRPIPVWFGGSADAALRRAAKYGQGWIPLGNP
ncbi:MAG: LLM class F420-dependent oxidoreductase, partial [Rhodospirillaceae bacterium]|nr:LLM class F420-dependent oxidoreductase [Rhodospirillaceae bacterium]